jgi:hypothetical protein
MTIRSLDKALMAASRWAASAMNHSSSALA